MRYHYDTHAGTDEQDPASPIFVQSKRDFFLEVLHLSHITRINRTLH